MTAAALAIAASIPLTAAQAGSYDAAPAPVASNTWYAGILGGVAYTPKIGGAKFKDPAWQVGANLGMQSGPMQYEGEFIFARSKFKNVAPVNARIDFYGVLANAIYNFNQLSDNLPVTPYVGAGIGWGHIKTSASAAGFSSSTSDNEFAYQGIAGVRYAVDNNTNVFVDYRYLGSTKSNKALGGNRYQNHTLNVGINVHFDGPALLS